MSSTVMSIPAPQPEPDGGTPPASPAYVPRPRPRRARVIANVHPILYASRIWYQHAADDISGASSGPRAGEQTLRARAAARANRIMRRGRRRLETLRRRRQRIDTSRHSHFYAAARWGEVPVAGPVGGIIPISAAVARERELLGQIAAEEHSGSRRHRRVSSGQRRVARLLPLLDLVIFTWFLSGVLNANFDVFDLASAGTVAVAVGLALLGTLAVAVWGTTVGQHLRRHKDGRRELVWDEATGVARGMVYLTAIPAALFAVMMFVRVHDTIEEATGDGGVSAWIIALALAVATVLVNTYILYLAFCDGSEVTDELDHLAKVIAPQLGIRDEHLVQVARHTVRIAEHAAVENNVRRRIEHAAARVCDSSLVAVRAARAARPAPAQSTDVLPADTVAALEQIRPDATIPQLIEADLPSLDLPERVKVLQADQPLNPAYEAGIRRVHRWF